MSANSPPSKRKKVTTRALLDKKARGQAISMLTAYDYPTALAVDRAGVDAILVSVGDRLIVMAFNLVDFPPPRGWEPRVLVLDGENRVQSVHGKGGASHATDD